MSGKRYHFIICSPFVPVSVPVLVFIYAHAGQGSPAVSKKEKENGHVLLSAPVMLSETVKKEKLVGVTLNIVASDVFVPLPLQLLQHLPRALLILLVRSSSTLA